MVPIQNPPQRTHDDTPPRLGRMRTKCPLCGKGPDTYEHVHQCVALDEIKREIEKETKVSAGAWEHATLFFRKRIDGAIFALVLAVYAAAWTIRGYRTRVSGGRGGEKLKNTIRMHFPVFRQLHAISKRFLYVKVDDDAAAYSSFSSFLSLFRIFRLFYIILLRMS